MFIWSTLIGTFPNAYAASVWKNVWFCRHIYPISLIDWITPISLWTNITEQSNVSGLKAFLSISKSNKPEEFSTGK